MADTAKPLPAALRIGLHEFRVYADDSGLVGDHSENRGSTHNETLTIGLDTRMPESLQRETMLHETLHACWDQTALRALDVDEHQELIITALSPLLVGLLRDNPALVEYLTADSSSR